MAIRETSDSGRPVVVSDPGGAQSLVYRDMARKVWATVSEGSTARPAPRIVIE